jgi:membrane-associated phospholipid phosphatase
LGGAAYSIKMRRRIFAIPPPPLHLPPSRLDIAAARLVARHAEKHVERGLGVLTWLADEKVVLLGSFVLAAYCHFGTRDARVRRCGDRIATSAVIAAALPHAIKQVVDRERPDRRVVHAPRHGVPRSGKPWDSFPSGHAVHLGALAAGLRRFLPRRLRPVLWSTTLALASTRVLLVAHYLSDVAAGLVMGLAIDRAVDRSLARIEAAAATLGKPDPRQKVAQLRRGCGEGRPTLDTGTR